MWWLVGVAVVLVIIYVVFLAGPQFKSYPDTSFAGKNAKESSGNNFIILKDGADSQASCQAACGNASWCKGYTLFTDNGNNTCVGVRNPNEGAKLIGGSYVSGLRVQGFAPKLMHLFGSESAGKSEGAAVPSPPTVNEFFTPIPPRTGSTEFFTPQAPATRLEFFTPQVPATRVEFLDAMAPPRVNEFFTPQPPATRVEFISGNNPYADTNAAGYGDM